MQKERKKVMPIAAKRAKVAKSRQEKKKKQQRAGKQFRGRKAWKWHTTYFSYSCVPLTLHKSLFLLVSAKKYQVIIQTLTVLLVDFVLRPCLWKGGGLLMKFTWSHLKYFCRIGNATTEESWNVYLIASHTG